MKIEDVAAERQEGRKFFLGFIFFLLSFKIHAESAFSPYIGTEIQQRNISFARNYGYGIFSKKTLQNNLHAGLKLNDNIGVEAGYTFSQKESKISMFYAGQFLLGEWFRPDPDPRIRRFITTETSVQTSGPNINVRASIPVLSDKTQIMGSIGFSVLNVKLQYKQLSDFALPEYTDEDIVETTNNFSSTRIVPRFTVGVQHCFVESMGVRATVGYELTGKFKQMASKNALNPPSRLLPGNGALRASLRNSIIYGLGVFMNF